MDGGMKFGASWVIIDNLTMAKKKPERYLKGSFTGLNIM